MIDTQTSSLSNPRDRGTWIIAGLLLVGAGTLWALVTSERANIEIDKQAVAELAKKPIV